MTAQDIGTENESAPKEFLDRIKKIAGKRKITPWLTSLGFSKADVARINAGAVVGSQKLTQLAVSENVSITWLLTGVGAPWICHEVRNAAEAIDLAQRFVRNRLVARFQRLHRSRGDDTMVLLSILPGTAERPTRLLMAGDFSDDTVGDLLHAIGASLNNLYVQSVMLPDEVWLEARAGRINLDALLPESDWQHFHESEQFHTAEPSVEVIGSVKQQLHDLVDELDDERAESLLKLLKSKPA